MCQLDLGGKWLVGLVFGVTVATVSLTLHGLGWVWVEGVGGSGWGQRGAGGRRRSNLNCSVRWIVRWVRSSFISQMGSAAYGR